MYFDQLSRMLQNAPGPMVFDDLQSRQTQSTFTDKPNGFLILSGANLQKRAPKVSINERFYKVF